MKYSYRKLRLFLCACARSIIKIGPVSEFIDIVDSNPTNGTLIKARKKFNDYIFKDNTKEDNYEERVRDSLIYNCLYDNSLLGYCCALVQREFKLNTLEEEILHKPSYDQKLVIFKPNDLPYIIAKEAYETRDFSNCPILADALEEWGWNYKYLLDHLRSNKKHYRGCWAIDFVLGLK